jgi:hypothetical protein
MKSEIGISDVSIDASELPAGIYLLKVNQGKNSEARTILKN